MSSSEADAFDEDDDYELLEQGYDTVLEAFPRMREADIVAVLREADYDAENAILLIQAKQRKASAKASAAGKPPAGAGGAKPTSSGGRGSGGASSGGGGAPASSAAPSAAVALSASSAGISSSAPQVRCLERVVAAPLPAVPAHVSAALASSRPSLAVAFIGHVDAGKSKLLGRLLYDVGLVSPRSLARLAAAAREAGKASFAFAWVLDEGAGERARGVTIDVGTNFFAASRCDVTLLDAPGHRDFVPTMMTAVAQADVAVLVVDATVGGFEAGWRDAPRDDGNLHVSATGSGGGGGGGGSGDRGGQTREHALLARALGVSQLIVAVNKFDAPGVDWSAARFRDISTRMMPFLTGVAGFKREAITFVPVSGLSGVNVFRAPVEYLSSTAAERREASEVSEMLEGLGLSAAGEISVRGPANVENILGAEKAGVGPGGGSRGGAVSRGGGGDSGSAHLPGSIVDPDDVRMFEAWYGRAAPTLVSALDSLTPPTRSAHGALRFCIVDAYAQGGGVSGITVTGRVEGGWVEVGTRVCVVPGGASGVVKGVTRCGAPVAVAACGAVVELLLSGFPPDASGLLPGAILAWPTHVPHVCIKLKARIAVVAGVGMPLVRGLRVTLHSVAGSESAVVSRLLRTLDRDGKTAVRGPRILPSGAHAVVRIVLARPQPLETYAEHKRLGRFVLRYGERTVAIGQVLKLGR